MKLLLIFLLAGCAPSFAQSGVPPTPPGLAGHPDCRSYFGVMWLDGIQEGQAEQATHFGLTPQQLEWWSQEGHKKNKTACYLGQIETTDGRLQAACPGCGTDWDRHFRWIVFEHRDEKNKRATTSSRLMTTSGMGAGIDTTGGRPIASVNVSDPSSGVEREVKVVSTGAAVYSGGSPMRAPSGQDRQLFYFSAEKDKSAKAIDAQIARNDREALEAAAQFVSKDAKH